MLNSKLNEIALVFLKLGTTAFGGPAAHIALMEDEVVRRRGWVDEQHFLDLVGATNLVPGPNSSEMAMHIGYERGRLAGLLLSGVCFILPAVLITLVFAWAYVNYGTTPEVGPFLAGIKPVVLAVIVGAGWRLGRKAISGWLHALLGAVVVLFVLNGAGEVPTLLGTSVVGMLALRLTRNSSSNVSSCAVPPFWSFGYITSGIAAGSGVAVVSLWKLGLFFLKVGAVLYGSGYVLVAFLEGDLVQSYGWLTQDQLLDAIAIGQLTPGPVLTTATFIGYVIAGVPGAIVATLGIFLPSFFFVLLLNPLIPRMRRSQWLSAFLDSVNVAAVGLLFAVTFELSRAAFIGWQAWLIFALAFAANLFTKINTAWLVLGGAIAGTVLL